MISINICESPDQEQVGETEIELIKFLGSGAYGTVYLTNIENIVIKIFETVTNIDKISLEYKIFEKLIEYSNKETYPHNLVRAMGRGILLSGFVHEQNKHYAGDRFILIPYYKKFYDVNIDRRKLREESFILDFISDLLRVCLFLEKKLNYIHLDIKTSNVMYNKNNKLILIDLGLVEKIRTGKEIFVPDKDYFIWPYDNCFLVTVPVYSIAICVIEFYFGKLKVWKIDSSNEVDLFVDNVSMISKSIGNILKKMISLKYDPSTVLKYIEIKYRTDLKLSDKMLDINLDENDENNKKSFSRLRSNRSNRLNESPNRNPVNKWYSNLLIMNDATNSENLKNKFIKKNQRSQNSPITPVRLRTRLQSRSITRAKSSSKSLKSLKS